MLFIEELQSDWNLEGRKKGFETKQERKTKLKKDLAEGKITREEYNKGRGEIMGFVEGAPKAPFVQDTSWQNLVMKRIMRMAVSEGYDRVAFINGEQTAGRYSLDKEVETIRVSAIDDRSTAVSLRLKDRTNGEIDIIVDRPSGKVESVADSAYDRFIGEHLSEVTGKEIAKKILKVDNSITLKEQDLKIEAKWARELYDVAIPNWLKGFGKNKDARVSSIDPGTGKQQVSIPVTDKMRDAVMGGQAMFATEKTTPGLTPDDFIELAAEMKRMGGNNIEITHLDEIIVDTADPAVRAKLKAHGLSDAQIEKFAKVGSQVAGAHRTRQATSGELTSLIKISMQAANRATGFHEIMHRMMDLALTDKQISFLLNKYGSVEKIANAYGKSIELLSKRGPLGKTEKIFATIKQFMEGIKNFATAKGWNSESKIASDIATGKYAEKADKATTAREWTEDGQALALPDGYTIEDSGRGFVARGPKGDILNISEKKRDAETAIKSMAQFEKAYEDHDFKPGGVVNQPKSATLPTQQTNTDDFALKDKLSAAASPAKPIIRGAQESITGLLKIMAPTSLHNLVPKSMRGTFSGYSTVAQRKIRARQGKRNHAYEQIRAKFKDSIKRFDKQTKIGKASTDFYEKHGIGGMAAELKQQGFPQDEINATTAYWTDLHEPTTNTFLDIIRQFKGDDFEGISHFVSHIYKDPQKAQVILQKAFSRNPVTGSEYFTKQRVYDTMAEAEGKGLERATDNPARNLMAYVNAVQQYEMGRTIISDLKDAGLLRTGKAVPAAEKEYWEEVDRDFIERTIPHITKKKDGTERVIGQTTIGKYYAPAGVAEMLNNMVSRNRLNFALGRGAARANAALNSVQLGMSMFHANFILALNGVNDLTIALSALTRGDFKKAGKSAIKAVAFPAQIAPAMMTGKKIMDAYKNEEVYAKAPKEIRVIVDALEAANGRIGVPDIYKVLSEDENINTVINKFKDGNIFGSGATGAALLLQTASKPLMEVMVPLVKLQGFAALYEEELLKHPDKAPADIAQYAWDRADDRFGQMTYDNLFWDRTFKSFMQLITRSVGWNLGDIREFGGAVSDTTRFVKKGVKGKLSQEDVTQKMLFAIALPTITAYIGGMMAYMMTGEPPDELLDFFAPPTGKTKPDGSPERLAIPTYMRDFIALKHQGVLTTAAHKSSPLVNIALEALKGQDYFGEELWADNATTEERMKEGALFLSRHLTPFSLRGVQQIKKNGGSARDMLITALGFTPAPKYITQTDDEKAVYDMGKRRLGGSRSKTQVAKTRALKKIETAYRKTGTWDNEALLKAKEDGYVNNIKRFKESREKYPGDVRLFGMFQADDQMALYEKFSDEGKERYAPKLKTSIRKDLGIVKKKTSLKKIKLKTSLKKIKLK